jgi:hypothetical protein
MNSNVDIQYSAFSVQYSRKWLWVRWRRRWSTGQMMRRRTTG